MREMPVEEFSIIGKTAGFLPEVTALDGLFGLRFGLSLRLRGN